jgi:ribosomal protein S18 acetylase RimI-like enzyme
MMTSFTEPLAFRIRVAAREDAAQVSIFLAREFSNTFDAYNTASDMAMYLAQTYSVEQQEREIADPLGPYLLLEIDGALAGIARLRIGSRDAQVISVSPVEVQRFYVSGAWHGRGIAHHLMAECVTRATAAGATTVWLGVWDQNARAIRFYEKCGFVDVGTATFVLGTDPQNDRVMARTIP